jgi:S1-C subfamily serine protease
MTQKINFTLLYFFVSNFIFAQYSNPKDLRFHTFLGINVDYDGVKTNGLYINGVYKNYGADIAGLERGDSLMAVNGIPIHDYLEFKRVCEERTPGGNVELRIIRDHRPQKLTAALSEWPEFLKYKTSQWYRDMKAKGKSDIRVTKLALQAISDWKNYGIKITSVNNNSTAANAGLEPGDIIIKMDNYEFATMEEFKYDVSRYEPGDVVTLKVLRASQTQSLKVRLEQETIHLDLAEN